MIARLYISIGCWLLIAPLVTGSILYAIHIWNIWGTLTDGNDYFDALVFILNYFTPIACLGVCGLFFLRRNGSVKRRQFKLAFTLLAILTLILCAFGILIFYGGPQPFRLSHFVWWFKPFGLLGI
jgi:hypothetical protein